MDYIAKPASVTPTINVDQFELFVNETLVDINGNEVIIPKSIGTYSIDRLNDEKKRYETIIAEIDEKIAAINLL